MSRDHPAHGPRGNRRRGCGWAITLDVAGAASADFGNRAEELRDLLEPYAGAVSIEPDRSRYGATFSIGQPDLDATSALMFGYQLFRDLTARAGMPTWPIVHAEITQVADHPDLRIVR